MLLINEQLSSLTFEQKADPILVLRDVCAIVCPDKDGDRGVLQGGWDGNYSEGMHPTFWNGSGSILQLFNQSGGTPVKYGQCWVMSGVLLTLLRVLGLPSRSVTNFSSARDSMDRTISIYINSEGERQQNFSSGVESIWLEIIIKH